MSRDHDIGQDNDEPGDSRRIGTLHSVGGTKVAGFPGDVGVEREQLVPEGGKTAARVLGYSLRILRILRILRDLRNGRYDDHTSSL